MGWGLLMGEAKDRKDPVTGKYRYFKGKNFRKKQGKFKKFLNATFHTLVRVDTNKKVGERPDETLLKRIKPKRRQKR